MNILITGSTGLIGTALSTSLTAAGHQVYPLHRTTESNAPFYWQPDKDIVHFDNSIHIDVVINLSGSNISDGRWTEKKKQTILNSRVHSTELLSKTISALPNPPSLFISGSAIGFYGETASNTVSETSPNGDDFLAEVALKWEQATETAKQAGIRTVNMRTGIVLSKNGGALQKMLTPFNLGLGGIVGNGQQYMSWVSLNEITRIIDFIIQHNDIEGPVNCVSPNAVSNKVFTKSLGQALSRPTLFPMPAFVAKLLFGEMADALLLTSIRVEPKKLQSMGYQFTDIDLTNTLKSIIKK